MSHQITLCKQCKKRSFSSTNGIVCSITSEKPTFEIHCPVFEKDEKEEKRVRERQAMEAAEAMETAEGGSSPIRVIFSILIFILVIIRIALRCSSH